jgi:hypothetical protein
MELEEGYEEISRRFVARCAAAARCVFGGGGRLAGSRFGVWDWLFVGSELTWGSERADAADGTFAADGRL